MKTINSFFIIVMPIVLMILLIPIIKSDLVLSIIYLLIISLGMYIGFSKKDLIVYIFGSVILLITEYFFISTGVEVFLRQSLFGVMPIWLPLLWGYSFVAIKRSLLLFKLI